LPNIKIIKDLYVPETFRSFAYGFVLGGAFMASPAFAVVLLAVSLVFLWLSRATKPAEVKKS